jgi:Na+/H+-dicarboxylate symporter
VITYAFMKRLNWQIWAGFVLSLVAGLSYPFVFLRWPMTRDFPWANLILFAIALVFLFLGLRRAFKPDKRIVSKIFSSLAAALGVLFFAGLLFGVFVAGRWLPASAAAPQVGQKAPDFTLADSNNKPVTLAQLLTELVNNKPPKAVLLIFYRGYW